MPPGAAGAGGWSLSPTPSLGWSGRHLPSAAHQLSHSHGSKPPLPSCIVVTVLWCPIKKLSNLINYLCNLKSKIITTAKKVSENGTVLVWPS